MVYRAAFFGECFWANAVVLGKEHFWISIVINSLGKGALADCFKRFPWAAEAVQYFFSGFIQKLIADTKKHESYTIEHVQR